MRERHNKLYNSIGFLKEEQESMTAITNLILGFSIYIFIASILEAGFFHLYNSKYHPFAKILDLSKDTEPSGNSKNRYIHKQFNSIQFNVPKFLINEKYSF